MTTAAMSTTRLAFLYPHLFFRAPAHAPWTGRRPRERAPCAAFATTTPPKQSSFKRHGKAVELAPLPPESEAQGAGEAPEPQGQKTDEGGAVVKESVAGTGGEKNNTSPQPSGGDGSGGAADAAAQAPSPSPSVIELGPPQTGTQPSSRAGRWRLS